LIEGSGGDWAVAVGVGSLTAYKGGAQVLVGLALPQHL